MNVEFLLEYLFAVGLNSAAAISDIPIKLWGRYLPETLAMRVRRLYQLPRDDICFIDLFLIQCSTKSFFLI